MSVIDLKLKTYDELTFEIARLNTDKYLLEQKLQQKENIIKEVREYIKNTPLQKGTEYYRIQLLQILDKVEEKQDD